MLADWLQTRRRLAGLTQHQLAFAAKCSLSLVQKIEHGERIPSVPVITALAQALNLPEAESLRWRDLVLNGQPPAPARASEQSLPALQTSALVAPAQAVAPMPALRPLIGREAELRALLKIPEDNQIYCVLPIGYPTDKVGPVKRKPVKVVAYSETYGTPWDYAEQQPANGWQERWLKK